MEICKYKRLFSKIDNAEIISFDVFDTLIRRNFLVPSDVFRYMQLVLTTENPSLSVDFCARRIEAERLARQRQANEISLLHIYNEFCDLSEDDRRYLASLEINVELEVCTVNNDFFPIYEYCLKANKRIIIVSDMYMSSDTIRSILLKNLIKGFSEVFVSCEIGSSKASGGLFEYLARKFQIPSKKILHIGDNLRADYIMPLLHGFSAFHFPKKLANLDYDSLNQRTGLIDESFMLSFVNNRLPLIKCPNERIGYEVFGPLLFAFSVWLHNELIADGTKKVFFLARDGRMLMRAYELMYGSNTEALNYLYVSRRSVFIPLLATRTSLEEFVKLLSVRKAESLIGVLDSIGISESEAKDALVNHGFKGDELFFNVIKQPRFSGFWDEMYPSIQEKARRQRVALLRYLGQNDFVGDVAVVDIGYRGTIQNSLESILRTEKRDTRLKGYYIGLNTRSLSYIREGLSAKGFLFDPRSAIPSEYEMQIKTFVGLFESFFLAHEGSVLGYADNEGVITPVLLKHECDEVQASVFHSIQEGSLKFIRDFNTERTSRAIAISPELSFRAFSRLGLYPSKCDLTLFGLLPFYDTELMPLIYKFSFIRLLISPKIEIKKLINSPWKSGQMKRLFKLALPYYKGLSIIKKFDKSE
jgi:HAD superfamily hydrolase (TIGR01549 family)